MRVKNKVVIVTGSGGGIGEGIARRLAEEGAHVVVNDIQATAGERVAAGDPAAPVVTAIFCAADVTRVPPTCRCWWPGPLQALRPARRDGQQRRLDPPQPPGTRSE